MVGTHLVDNELMSHTARLTPSSKKTHLLTPSNPSNLDGWGLPLFVKGEKSRKPIKL